VAFPFFLSAPKTNFSSPQHGTSEQTGLSNSERWFFFFWFEVFFFFFFFLVAFPPEFLGLFFFLVFQQPLSVFVPFPLTLLFPAAGHFSPPSFYKWFFFPWEASTLPRWCSFGKIDEFWSPKHALFFSAPFLTSLSHDCLFLILLLPRNFYASFIQPFFIFHLPVAGARLFSLRGVNTQPVPHSFSSFKPELVISFLLRPGFSDWHAALPQEGAPFSHSFWILEAIPLSPFSFLSFFLRDLPFKLLNSRLFGESLVWIFLLGFAGLSPFSKATGAYHFLLFPKAFFSPFPIMYW